MYYPTLHHVEAIIRDIGKAQNTKLVITNRGQLEFALEKPKMIVYGSEQYPELYQKAAILMETITKAHVLSDGNKRTAMLVAQLMIDANGGRLVLPLKSVRLSVDAAMDNDDAMPEIIRQWFKVHTAMNACNLAVMLSELDEEEEVIKAMLKENKSDDANNLLGRWMAFDRYPQNRQVAGELIRGWEKREKMSAAKHTASQHAGGWSPIWKSFMASKNFLHAQYRYPIDRSGGDARKLRYNYNSMAELQAAEEQILEQSAKCEEAKDASLVHRSALRLERHGMYDDAIDMFDRLRTLNWDEFDAVSHIAMITQYGLDDPQLAIKHWNRCIKHNPEDPVGNLYMGEAFVKLGQYSSARICLERIRQGGMPSGLKANIRMGRMYDKMHEYGRAAKFYEKEIFDDPSNSDAYRFLGAAYSNMGNEEKAIEYFDMGIGIDPDDPEGYWNKGLSLSDLGRYEESIASYRKALEINPDHLESKINLASTISNSGKPAEALPYFYSALELDPDHPVALEGLVVTLMCMNRTGEALAHADKLVDVDTSDPSAKYLKALILAEMGRVGECLELLKRLADTDSNFKTFVDLKISQGAFDALLNYRQFKNLMGN